ncbi:unnamed protein product [Rhizoctonia solani]|uniref:tyrosinase n=1 Tax=Rhizoctonia solani TaxID=456999 RepID=A0A8H2XRL2_9AGAM|nr:unnamed protein product [Rhizoctonia solani]
MGYHMNAGREIQRLIQMGGLEVRGQTFLGVDITHNTKRGSLGYCNHASILFPTWHRPSLMLLEQSIWEEAKKKAEEYAKSNPEQASEWRTAANKLRFPYWDWTNPEKHDRKFPQIFRQPKVTLQTPKGTEEYDNPLYTYAFGSKRPAGFRDTPFMEEFGDNNSTYTSLFGTWDRTYRWPSHGAQEADKNPTEQIDKIDSYLNRKPLPGGQVPTGSWQDLQRQVAPLFQYPEDLDESDGVYAWDAFSNTRPVSKPRDWSRPGRTHYWDVARKLRLKGSIEQPHNLIHLLVGGLGHMMNNDYASFDPIFFLHHCNVDRILAFWEYAYPKYFMGKDGYKDQNGNTQQFRQPGGKFGWGDQPLFLKGDTPLTPFRKADGSYWTSDDTRWASKVPKNYTYEDIEIGKKVLDPLGPSDVSAKLRLTTAQPVAGLTSLSRSGIPQAQAALGALSHPASPSRPFEVHCAQTPNPQVESARGCLQKLFGFNPVPARQEAYRRLGESQRLVYPPKEKEPSTDYDPIWDYRQFIVRIHLDPYAFDCSHMINISFNTVDPNNQTTIGGLVGSAAVLSRSKDTECDACQGRREERITSVYSIPIPHDIITDMALHSREMNVVDLLRKALRAEIVLPGGQPFANTPTTVSSDPKPLPEKYIPEITLHSSALQARFDGIEHDRTHAQDHSPLTPCEAYDWQYHGELFQAENWNLV